ncbi:MAG: DUF6616 family protein [Phycisphaerales bacterium JB063]
MHVLVEWWNARPAWAALSAEDRRAYVAQLGPAIEQLMGLGIEIVAFAQNTDPSPQRAGYDYLAVWTLPDADTVATFHDAVTQAGWHDYFDQVNASGEVQSPDVVLGALAQ